MGTTVASAIRETVTVNAIVLGNTTPSTTAPAPVQTVVTTVQPNNPPGTTLVASNTDPITTTDFFSNDPASPTDTDSAGIPTLSGGDSSGGALAHLAPSAGLVALLSSIVLLL